MKNWKKKTRLNDGNSWIEPCTDSSCYSLAPVVAAPATSFRRKHCPDSLQQSAVATTCIDWSRPSVELKVGVNTLTAPPPPAARSSVLFGGGAKRRKICKVIRWRRRRGRGRRRSPSSSPRTRVEPCTFQRWRLTVFYLPLPHGCCAQSQRVPYSAQSLHSTSVCR